MKKILFVLLVLFAILPLTAEGKQIYYRSVYGEDFYLIGAAVRHFCREIKCVVKISGLFGKYEYIAGIIYNHE